VLACAPVMRHGVRIGWLVGVSRLRDVLDAGLQRTYHAGFSAGVLEGSTLLYGASVEDGGPGGSYGRDAALVRGPLIWTIDVWPDEEQTKELESRGPVALFVAGMLLAFFASAALYMWREQRDAAKT
jgi:hypothetical protein